MTQQNRMDKTREKIAKLIHLRYGFQDFEETGYKSPKEVEEKPC